MSWLREYVDVDLEPERLAEVLTLGGLVVEAIHRPSAGVRGVVVARVEAIERVPGSDKLSLVEVSDGTERHEIVCGASNFAVGDLVPAALPGATLPGGVQIGRRSLMGVTSNGMLASARELGVGDDHRGIWVLEPTAPLGAAVAGWLDLDDAVLELDLNPDRGYAQSMLGVARDVAALTGARLTLPPEPDPAAPPSGDPGVPVAILDPERCPRFDAHRIVGVTVRPSPAWLQRRLVAAGVRPINAVVDATNHTMLEVGSPIHAYDTTLLAGPAIVVRVARPGETLVTLDGVERALDPDDLVIADAERPVGLAGVMGGEATEIRDATTDVLLETANFSARNILRTARRHQLFTEGSKRWEKRVPPEVTPGAAARCAALIVDLAGGEVTGRSDTYPHPRERPVITLRPDRARRRLGLDLDDARQAALLRSIACEVGEALDGRVPVTPPAYRPDLEIEEDLYEEIARLEGYERIPERVPGSGRVGGRPPDHVARNAVRHALAGAGWSEVLPFPFIAPEDIDALGLPAYDPRRRSVALTNPLSKQESVLHTTLLPGLARVVRHNVNRQVADLALFEVSRVFLPPTADEPGAPGGAAHQTATPPPTLPAEPLLLGFAACGAFETPRHDRPGRPADLADVLGAADVVRAVLGLPALEAEATAEMPFHPGRAARLSLPSRDGSDPVPVGVVGELHPRVTAALGVPARTLAGELRLDLLTARGIVPARPDVPSALPPLRIDVAVVVGEDVPAAAVADAVRAGAGPHLTALTLFDDYRGASIGEGRRSLAYGLLLEDPTRQLTDDDAHEVIDAVDAAVATGVGGHLRR